MSKYLLILFTLLSLFSCKRNNFPDDVERALAASGVNRLELEKVISYYQKPEDSLKLKAAYFLIGNMLGKSYSNYSSAQSQFIELMKSSGVLTADTIKTIWDDLKQVHRQESQKKYMDLEELSSAYLISNIEEAFKVWKEAPWSDDYSFDDFCDYVLPYRNFYDIPESWRTKFREELSPIASGSSILETCLMINEKLDSIQFTDIFYEWSNLHVSDILAIKLATCLQYNSLKIYAARAMGVPVVDITALHSTSYVGIIDKDGFIIEWEWDKKPKRNDSTQILWAPKKIASTFRNQTYPFSDFSEQNTPPLYSKNIVDITDKGHEDVVTDVKITLPDAPKNDFCFANVFNYNNGQWSAAGWSAINNQQVNFHNMALGNVYLPAYYIDTENIPAGYPFFIEENGRVHELKPDFTAVTRIKLLRKYPLGDKEKKFAEALKNAVIEGSNDSNFQKSITLHTISETPQIMVAVDINSQKNEYRYIRIKSDATIALSNFDVYSLNGNKITGIPIAADMRNFDIHQVSNLFDGDIRTNCTLNEPGWVGINFGKPTQVGKISYMFRNSFNTVEKGHLYELMVWNNKWLSLGTRIARSANVEFDAPKNALLLLKDHTTGVQELPFYMKDNKQIWALSWGNEL